MAIFSGSWNIRCPVPIVTVLMTGAAGISGAISRSDALFPATFRIDLGMGKSVLIVALLSIIIIIN